MNTLAITQSLTAGVAAGLAALGGKGPKGEALIQKLESLLMGAKAMLLARESAAKGTFLQVPVRVKLRIPLQDAVQARQALSDAGHTVNRTEEQLRRSAKKGMVQVDVVTTNLHLREFDGDARAALAAGKADIALGAALGSAAGGTPVISLTRAQYAKFMTRQTTLWEKAALTLREMAQGVKGGGLSLDGHIGLVALLLNGVSVYGTLSDASKTMSDADTFWGVMDSSAGTVGGLAQVTQSAIGASIAARVGAKAAEKSLWVMGMGVAVSGAGAFGGMATAAGQFVKAGRADDSTVFRLYTASGLSFLAQGTTSSVQFIGAFSEFMIAKGSQRAMWFTGARVAAGVGTRLVALTGLGLTGWGLVFLAGGLIFEVGVVLLTPDRLQKHVQNSYFGKGGDAGNKYKSLVDEDAGARALTEAPKSPEPAPDKRGEGGTIPELMVGP